MTVTMTIEGAAGGKPFDPAPDKGYTSVRLRNVKPPIPSGYLVRFGVFELDLRARELRKNGNSTGLPEQSIKILALLLEKPGEVVLRQEIRKKLWPNDTVVEFDHSINAAMKRLRQVLGDSPDDPHFIETLARRGYRWKISAEWVESQGEAAARVEMAGGGQAQTASDGSLIGKKVSHYRVLEILGGGGMGVIYKAEDLKLGRRVALKFLPEEVASEPSALERFEREARAASALDHPNICAIHEFGEHEGQPFIVMQLLEGQTLRERIGAEPPQPGDPLPTDELLDFAIQITRGLEAAHQKGIIHRDIKPANIFLTNRGEAKILDFGVAKIVHADGQHAASAPPDSPDKAPTLDPSSSLNLTTTGSTVGTASYMSPEQILGEKLDARTDLFSFGLVLHEMATGQQAFAGETATFIREAILRRAVQPVRQLNPELPSQLEEIIARSLRKDREARYQTAPEVRAALESLNRHVEARLSIAAWRKIAAALVVFLLIVTAGLWFVRRQPSSSTPSPDVQVRQLTYSSAENFVVSGAISPDGKYLAYTDSNGVHIQNVATDENQPVAQPETFGDRTDLEVASWFPDATRFLVNSHPTAQKPQSWSSEGSIIWVVSVLGGAPRKLRDNAVAYSVSPDGSLISFGTNKGRLGDREVWLMGPSGEQARMLYGTDEDGSLEGFGWSRDAKRVMYVKTDGSGSNIVVRALAGGSPTTLLSSDETTRLKTHLWLGDGRMVYSLMEAHEDFGDRACNIWQMRLDASSSKPVEKSKRLTNWPGTCIDFLSATADGGQLVFRKSAGHITTNVADLDASGFHIANAKHFTLTDSWDLPEDWTADSKAILLISNRTGHWGIFKQALAEDTAKVVVAGTAGLRNPRVSADGNWVLYPHDIKPGVPSSPSEILRVPITGGVPEVVSTARPGAKVLCAKSPSKLCALVEPTRDGRQLVITAFDPVKGRGSELLRFALNPTSDSWTAELSPDGTSVAALQSPEGPIHIYLLSGQAPLEIALSSSKNLGAVHFLHWAADGRGLFVSDSIRLGGVLLHLDLQGNAQVLWKNQGVRWNVGPPSPDGRYLAILSSPWEGNLWALGNF